MTPNDFYNKSEKKKTKITKHVVYHRKKNNKKYLFVRHDILRN